jgi:hypothetical protein
MHPRNLLIPLLTAAGLLAQQTEPLPKEKVQITKTERAEFPSGGLLRLTHSIGDVAIEAWDNPGIEITTVKSTKVEVAASEREHASTELEKITISLEHHTGELEIVTNYPRGFPPPSVSGSSNGFDLEYRIRVPRSARLAIDHYVGDVNVDGLVGDIQAKVCEGEIMLHLPQDALYSIDAKITLGRINSDYAGTEKRRMWVPVWGHSMLQQAPLPAHSLNLRVGFGDIVILKTQIPKSPESTSLPAGRSGS